MNAADAISAAESTLRDGRNAALRKPSRDTAHEPRPSIGRRSRDRSHRENASRRRDQQRSAGAEERTGLRRTIGEAVRRAATTPRPLQGRGRQAQPAAARPMLRRGSTSSACAVEERPRRQPCRTAPQRDRRRRGPPPATPPAAPATSDGHDTCSVSSGRPDRADPPRRAGRARSAARRAIAPATPSERRRQSASDERLGEEQPPDASRW